MSKDIGKQQIVTVMYDEAPEFNIQEKLDEESINKRLYSNTNYLKINTLGEEEE